MDRRTFVKNTTLATAATIAAPYILTGEPKIKVYSNDHINSFEDDSIMIIIELFGGNDGLNTIIPAYNDLYYTLRPNLSYPLEFCRRFENSDLYFNPNLVDGIHNGGLLQMFAEGKLAIIEGIGYDNPNLSHFRSQDIWLSGINNSNNSVKLTEGWLGRFIARKLPGYPLEIPEHPLAIQVGGTLSLLLKSNIGDMGIALTDPDKFYELGAGLTPTESIRTGNSRYDREYNFVYTIAKQSEVYSKAVKQAYDKGKELIKVNYSSGLAQKFRLISSLIAGGLKTKVYFVSLSNFDSHAQQQSGYYEGQHPTLLRQVANAISEFMDDAIQLGYAERIAGMTISEFGRRAYDNGSNGTDHGAASMQFVFGHDNYVNGAYYREQGKPDLSDLDDAGNIKFQYDYRRTFVDFLQSWMGANDDDIVAVFGQKFMPIGVLNPRAVSVDNFVEFSGNSAIKIYPNPSNGKAFAEIILRKSSEITLEVYNLLGYKVKTIYNGNAISGVHKFDLNINDSGSYYCLLTIGNKKYSARFIINK